MRFVSILALAGMAAGAPQDATSPLSEDEKILHLLSRFTPGATPELAREVRERGWKAWFEEQLRGEGPESGKLTALLSKMETTNLSMEEILEKYNENVPKDATPREKAEARRRAMIPTTELLGSVGLRAVLSRHGIRQVSGDFFRNHFAVSIEKGIVRTLVVDWERQVILKHSLGNFGDMLEASAKHPAMLFYLDNCLSRKPPTPEELVRIEDQVRRRTGSEERADEAVDLAKQRGLNENYGRELLELHTLGVDRYYTQDDVISAAKCLTGWTLRRRRGSEFHFDSRMHCPGDKPFLGGVIKENRANPVAEGEHLLDILKKHEGTAQFVSWKLCRYFVNDEPNPDMVKRVAQVFRSTQGDLPKVFKAIAEDPSFFARENYRSKFKRPWEFVVSALRVTQAEFTGGNGLNQTLAAMNEPLYRCADPTGYYDQAEAWCDPGAIAFRWTFAHDLANGRVSGAKIPGSFYSDLPPDKPKEWKDILVAKILPICGLSTATSANLDKLIQQHLGKSPKATPAQLGPVIVAALLGSPEFQKQ